MPDKINVKSIIVLKFYKPKNKMSFTFMFSPFLKSNLAFLEKSFAHLQSHEIILKTDKADN